VDIIHARVIDTANIADIHHAGINHAGVIDIADIADIVDITRVLKIKK